MKKKAVERAVPVGSPLGEFFELSRKPDQMLRCSSACPLRISKNPWALRGSDPPWQGSRPSKPLPFDGPDSYRVYCILYNGIHKTALVDLVAFTWPSGAL